jgi:hypothetical protein
LLLVVSCLLSAGAVFQSFRFSQSHQIDRTRLLNVERSAGRLLVSLGEMRAARMASLATGQGPEFWLRRATELSRELETGITQLRASLVVGAAQAHLDTASTALADLTGLDDRARQALEGDQRYLASDLIFTDSVTTSQRISDAIESARAGERASIEAALDRDRAIALALFPASLVLILISAWLAGSSRDRQPARSEAEELAQMLRALPPPVKAPGVQAATVPPVATPPSRAAVQPDAVTESARSADGPAPTAWPELAELCVDLARVIDARDMPSLLQRIARALDARGIIVWIVDTGGARLTPALAHGYSDRVLAKLGTLDINADNVTSLSFRSMRPQLMPGAETDSSSSAIAVPLVTTEGCTGVLSAEVGGAAPSAGSVAVARILAAQLATMLTPVELSAQRAAEA